MSKPLILGINGSTRKDGHVAGLLKSVMGSASKLGAETRIINLAEYLILPHDGKLDDKASIEDTSDDMPGLQRLVLKADGLVLATPTHWFNMSSRMKLFTDRLTSLEHNKFLLEGKVAGLISYGPQGGALVPLMILTTVVLNMGMVIPPYCLIFDEGRNEKWPKYDKRVMAKNMLHQIKVSKRFNWGYPKEKYKFSPIELLKDEKNKNKKI